MSRWYKSLANKKVCVVCGKHISIMDNSTMTHKGLCREIYRNACYKYLKEQKLKG